MPTGVPATWQFNGVCSLHHTLGNAENMSQEVDCFRWGAARHVTTHDMMCAGRCSAIALAMGCVVHGAHYSNPILLT